VTLARLLHSARGVSATTASRLFSVVTALASGTVLGLAWWLDPSPLGHSTHLQLGLSPCTVLQLTGVPCPMCGMTTTFALMADLRPLSALLNQPFGVLLFFGAVAMFGVSVAEAVQPRDRWTRMVNTIGPYDRPLAAALLAAMTLGWAWKAALVLGWISFS
jgi:hypothetical protein